MIPILYRQDEEQFTSNGLGRLTECVSCIVTEERNGIYECQFQYPITGEMYPEIMEGRVIAVIHDDAHDIQPFDIYARSAPLNGLVTFYAHHISYRLGNIIMKPTQASSCAAALELMKANTYNRNPFTFWTDKSVAGIWRNKTPSAVKALLAGQEGSILDVYGTGEYEFDKFAVKLYLHRGRDNGVTVRYGVNLTDLTQTTDMSGSYTAAAPYWVASDTGDVVTLPEGYVVNPNAETVLVPWTNENGEIITTETGEPIEFAIPDIRPIPMDLSEDFETEPTPEQMRTKAIQRMNSAESWMMDENITVKFADLAHTEEYKDVAALQRVKLCDRVNVYCGPMGVSAVSVQVIRVVFNALTELYDEIELGKPRRSYSDTIMEKVNAAVADVAENTVSRSVLEAAVANATAHITGANGGHIRDIYNADGDRMELVIIDTLDIATATKVWRWNLGGLGYSRNGYDGPYTTAITQDGHIVADFVDVGTLNANIIGAHTIAVDKLTGSLSGGLENTWGINFLTGTLTIGNISAANITAGTLSADRIAANSITVSKLTGTISNSGWELNLTAGTFTIGNISANNINAGTMSAARIQGGDLILGGANHTFGRLLLKDSSDVTVTTLDETGLTINKGAISLGGNFTVTSAGILTCSGASINGTLRTISGDYKAEMASGKLLLSQGTTVVGQLQWQGPKQMYAMPSSASLQGTGAVSLYAATNKNYPYGIHIDVDGTMTFHCKKIHIDENEDAVTADCNTISPMVKVKGVGKDYVFYFTNGMLTKFEEETPSP